MISFKLDMIRFEPATPSPWKLLTVTVTPNRLQPTPAVVKACNELTAQLAGGELVCREYPLGNRIVTQPPDAMECPAWILMVKRTLISPRAVEEALMMA